MKKIAKAVVVIPIYSAEPSANELISFTQCFHILGNHPIFVVAPKGLSLINYKAVIEVFNVIFIEPKWQENVLSYNKLKTSRFFYELFKQYEFLLTYELDAFVFKDDLLYWCEKNYDYIGAPWFENYITATPQDKIIGVGNSGFSLRKIDSVRRLLKRIFYKNPLEFEADALTRCKAYIKSPFRWFMGLQGENYTVQKNFHYHEDVFFSFVAPKYEPTFRVASVNDAIAFSFEVNPAVLYRLNHHILPMGCHAWWRYDIGFWTGFIKSFGYEIE